ncbi:Receptor-type tyrosine-protein phosphatase gamma [Collichthys lucidus]|uniref:Receptor-type tyrosine-protein phosphatase gamma n=1 Tax=Collichthys lucidus TaxID=240159 RepID=A0A4U5TUY5_COLLU|nr:Receptor-type tyrosine-protein phosphatase gamma [Collichthys lucidus]
MRLNMTSLVTLGRGPEKTTESIIVLAYSHTDETFILVTYDWCNRLEAFYSIFTTEQQDHVKSVEYLRSNFRPIQSLDNRHIFKSAVKDAWLPDLTDSGRGPYGTEASKVCSSAPINMKVQHVNDSALVVRWAHPEVTFHPPILHFLVSYSWTAHDDSYEETHLTDAKHKLPLIYTITHTFPFSTIDCSEPSLIHTAHTTRPGTSCTNTCVDFLLKLGVRQNPETVVRTKKFRCIKVSICMDQSTFLLYIPINVELSAHNATNKGKKINFTESELKILVNEVEILFGSLSTGLNMTKKRCEWERVCEAVNAVGSEQRTHSVNQGRTGTRNRPWHFGPDWPTTFDNTPFQFFQCNCASL